MPATQIATLAHYAKLQLAAEAFLLQEGDGGVVPNEDVVRTRLESGNDRSSVFTAEGASQFVARYKVLAQFRNDPALEGGSGFSGTLFLDKETGERILSFRSTEFIDDAIRDGTATGAMDIRDFGWAMAQIVEMEEWYAHLRADPNLLGGKRFTVTGYSLGGHLATAFSLLRREQYAAFPEANPVIETYTFNGAGTGSLLNGKQLTELIEDFKRIRSNYASSPEWQMLSPSQRNVVEQLAQRNVELILEERDRLMGTSGIENSLFQGKRAPVGDQATYEYQITLQLLKTHTTGAFDSNPPTTKGPLVVGSELKSAPMEERFPNMWEVVGMETEGLATSFVSNSGIHYGTRVHVPIESQPYYRGTYILDAVLQTLAHVGVKLLVDHPNENDFGDTHSLTLLVDSLSLLATIESIAPNITMEGANQLLAAISSAKVSTTFGEQGLAEGDTLERMLDALRKIVFGPDTTPTFNATLLKEVLRGNTWHELRYREPFHRDLRELSEEAKKREIEGTLSIDNLVGVDANTLRSISQGSEAIGYRYALKELNPFALVGNASLYEQHNAGGGLDLYDPSSARRVGLTGDWIADRADLLWWKNEYSITNGGLLRDTTRNENRLLQAALLGDEWLSFTVIGNLAASGNSGASANPQKVTFGGEASDVLVGGDLADRMYGGESTDLLEGRANLDYLEGGAGLDVYDYKAFSGLVGSGNDGEDVILDIDGKGVLRYTFSSGGGSTTTIIGSGIVRDSGEGWVSADGRFSFLRSQNDLIIEIVGDAGGRLTLRDWREGDFGIRFWVARPHPQTAGEWIVGDRVPVDIDSSAPGIQTEKDHLGNVVVTNDIEPGREDVLLGDRPMMSGTPMPGEKFDAGGGNDIVFSDRPNLQPDNGFGNNDWILAGAGRDWVEAGAGNDLVEAGPDSDIVDAGGGDDEIYADAKVAIADAILQGDVATPEPGKGDFLSGGAGKDWIVGSAAADAVLGGGHEDLIVAGAGDDNVWGDRGGVTSTLEWEAVRQQFDQGGIGQYRIDLLWESPGDTSEGGNDVIYGGQGNDWIFGGAGDDYIDGGSEHDVLFGEAGLDILVGGAGNDVINGDNPGVVPEADEGADYLDGGDGFDQLFGNGGDDILFGGAGNDVLLGGAGDDIIIGGAGEDILIGGPGRDTYVFNRGDGVEVISDTPATSGDSEASILSLGPGISPLDVKFRLGSLMLDLGEGDAIHFDGFDPQDPFTNPLLSSIRFNDGSVLSYDDILSQGFDLDGTEEADFIEGTAVTDRIDAREGNDVVNGRGGDDVIQGGAGIDVLLGGDGNDELSGGGGVDKLSGQAGDDTLHGNEGDDVLHGHEGNDVLDGGAGADELVGGVGDDVLTGGSGDDRLVGNEGSDTYLFALGDGQDVVADEGKAASNLADTHGVDVIRLGAGVDSTSTVLLRRANGDLVIRYSAADEIVIEGHYLPDRVNAIERIEFADGTVIDSEALSALEVSPIEGSDAADELRGTSADDVLIGFDGDDVLDGGPRTLTGNTTPTGNDRLEGGAGADSYSVYLGMGLDTIVDASAETSTLRLAPGLTLESIKAQRIGDDLLVQLRGTLDAALIKGYYDFESPSQAWDVATSDGTTVNMEDVISRPDPTASDEAAAAKADYKQRLISEWTVLSRSVPLPTHVRLFETWSQTTVHFRLNLLSPPQTTVLPAVTDQFFLDFGVLHQGKLVPLPEHFVQFNISTQVLQHESNNLFIGTIGQPDSHTVRVPYGITLGPSMRVISESTSVSTFSGSANVTNVIKSRTSDLWRSITLTENSGDPSELGFELTIRNEERIIEEITGGAAANEISGAEGGTHVALIDAGGGPDRVFAGPDDFVYGNDGNDEIEGGRIVYGGNGSDILIDGLNQYGGAGNDTLRWGKRMAGGAGDDVLTGAWGETTFLFAPGEAGEDVVIDQAGIDEEAFADEYYRALGFDEPDENRKFGGMFVVDRDPSLVAIGIAYADAERDPDDDDGFLDRLGVEDDYAGSSDYRGIAYVSLTDLLEEFARFGIAYRPEDIRYIVPLPPIGEISANDYALLQPLYEGGGIELDVVELGPGIQLSDLGFGWGQINADLTDDGENNPKAHVTLDVSIANEQTIRVVIPRARDPIGSGIERFSFADGSSLTLWEAIQLAPPAPELTPLISIVGTADDDLLEGTEDEDALSGLAGNDALVGDEGSDRLMGGTGDDFLDGGKGHDSLDGGQGGDILIGGRGRDVLAGGPGDDALDGGRDNDVYYFALGDGHDVIEQWSADESDVDVLRFGPGIAPADVTVTRNDEDAVLSINGGNESVTHFGWFEDEIVRIARVEFEDGTVWDHAYINDLLGPQPPTVIEGTDGNDVLEGDDGENVLVGGPGDDLLDGGLGDDTYQFGFGDGVDRISDSGGIDTLSFGTGIAPEMLTLGLGSLLIRVGDGGDEIHIEGFEQDHAADPIIDLFQFENGISLSYTELLARGIGIEGTPGDDVLSGTSVDDYLLALGGDDVVSAGSGGDILDGGSGNDLLSGGEGDDIYVFGPGYGRDRISDASGQNEVSLLGPASRSDLKVQRSMDDIVLTMDGTADSLTFVGWFAGQTSIERVVLQNGEEVSRAELESSASNLAPVASEDQGEITEDATEASGNVLANDADADGIQLSLVNVGAFAGTYGVLELSSNGDYRYQIDPSLVQSLRQGTFVAETFFYRVSDNDPFNAQEADGRLEITVVGANDAPLLNTTIADREAQAGTEFSFSLPQGTFLDVDEGDVLTYQAVLAGGTILPDWLSFNPATLEFAGAPGNDVTGSFALAVTATDLAGAAASGQFQLTIVPRPRGVELNGTKHDDRLAGTQFDDVLTGHRGDDRLHGGAGSDLLSGGDGDDRLHGEEGADLLQGGSGDDKLFGDTGDDLLAGGKGDDLLQGGVGDDVYFYGRKDGHDRIRDAGGTDVLLFGEGIVPRDVRLQRRQDDLYLELNGSNGDLTLEDWFASEDARIEHVQFADGSSWDVGEMRDRSGKQKKKGDGHGHGAHDHEEPALEQGCRDNHESANSRHDDHIRHEHDSGWGGGGLQWVRELIAPYLRSISEPEFERADEVRYRDGKPDPHFIARRWRAIARYARELADHSDEGAYGGSNVAWSLLNELEDWGFHGAGHGYMQGVPGVVKLRAFAGLEEGFRTLRC